MDIIFTQPFTVNAALAEKTEGRVAVLDLGFNNGAPNSSDREADFRNTTGAFIEALGDRLALWVDHHPHIHWVDYASNPRFTLKPREEASACPPVITPELVVEVDTIVAHGDFDGVMSAAKYALGGVEPYEGADADAIAADTRRGELSERGLRYEEAMKADLRDDSVREAVFYELVTGKINSVIDVARAKYAEIQAETGRLAGVFEPKGEKVMFVDAAVAVASFDLTQLLIAGQRDGKVAIVLNVNFKGEPQLTIAGGREWDFVSLLGLPGGMPNRVNVNPNRLGEVIELVNG